MPLSRKKRASARRRLPQEGEQLHLARTVQASLLPPPLSTLPGAEVAARFLPSHAVGGDFCDCFLLGPKQFAVYLGDVQGKGLEGAMYALLVSGLMRGLPKSGNEPASVVSFLNHRLCVRPLPGKFCALSYAVFDLEQRRLTVANAGLPFPLLLRNGALTRVEVPGVPVGLFQLCDYDQAAVSLQPGDRLLFYTDGLPDSLETLRPRAGDGEKQLAALLTGHADHSAAALADALLRRLTPALPKLRDRRAQELHDDATFLVVHIQ